MISNKDILKEIQIEIGKDYLLPDAIINKLEIITLMDIKYLKIYNLKNKNEFIIFNKYCLKKFFDKYKEKIK